MVLAFHKLPPVEVSKTSLGQVFSFGQLVFVYLNVQHDGKISVRYRSGLGTNETLVYYSYSQVWQAVQDIKRFLKSMEGF
jgi:hypothetical protein